MRLRIWIARARSGECEDATGELRDSVLRRRNPFPATWVLLVAGLFCDSVGESSFLDGAESTDPRRAAEIACEARYFAAMKRLVKGERDLAAKHLQACADTGARELDAWWAARQELAALRR